MSILVVSRQPHYERCGKILAYKVTMGMLKDKNKRSIFQIELSRRTFRKSYQDIWQKGESSNCVYSDSYPVIKGLVRHHCDAGQRGVESRWKRLPSNIAARVPSSRIQRFMRKQKSYRRRQAIQPLWLATEPLSRVLYLLPLNPPQRRDILSPISSGFTSSPAVLLTSFDCDSTVDS